MNLSVAIGIVVLVAVAAVAGWGPFIAIRAIGNGNRFWTGLSIVAAGWGVLITLWAATPVAKALLPSPADDEVGDAFRQIFDAVMRVVPFAVVAGAGAVPLLFVLGFRNSVPAAVFWILAAVTGLACLIVTAAAIATLRSS